MTGFEAAYKGRPLAGLPDVLVQAMARHGVGSVALALRKCTPLLKVNRLRKSTMVL